jgi:vancomycin resistance protein YoaR
MFRSSSFRRLISRLSIAGILILLAFPLGVLAYLYTLSVPAPQPVKNFSALITQASAHDTTVHIGDKNFIIKKGQISQWTEPYVRIYSGQSDVRFTNAIDAYIATLAQKTDKNPIDARFTINEDAPVTILVPAQNGQHLNTAEAGVQLRRAILANTSEVTLTPEIIEPAVTAEKIVSLGISNRIAIGESNFAGSTPARIQNIKAASRLYNGLIIKPGERFSFNTVLGDVDASTGYAPEKVIKSGKIQYEYGGGICQVSTTLFRAAIAAGFPILERKNHAFPVHYYEPQGFDATIYPGVSDMRFINDTKGPVLVQTHIVGTKITFEIYGTGDGRSVTVDGPHQFDIQPDGSMKASLARTITYADGTTKQDHFNSNYKSPKLYPTEPNPYE